MAENHAAPESDQAGELVLLFSDPDLGIADFPYPENKSGERFGESFSPERAARVIEIFQGFRADDGRLHSAGVCKSDLSEHEAPVLRREDFLDHESEE